MYVCNLPSKYVTHIIFLKANAISESNQSIVLLMCLIYLNTRSMLLIIFETATPSGGGFLFYPGKGAGGPTTPWISIVIVIM